MDDLNIAPGQVQLVHIEGPLAGQIQQTGDFPLTLGHGAEAGIRFPAQSHLSARHAEIVRRKDRFLFINHSRHGSRVNGRAVQRCYLSLGDVISLGDEAKFSFLCHSPTPLPPPAPMDIPHGARTPSYTPKDYTLQFDEHLRSFCQEVVKVGRGAENDFVIPHALVCERQFEIYFDRGHYRIRDRSKGHTYLNGNTLETAVLHEDDILRLGDTGPLLRYLGEGCFLRHDASPPPAAEEEDFFL